MDTTIIPFWKNKIFWTGLAAAVIMAVQQLFLEPSINWSAMALAGVMAIAGYVATTLRGQNTTMAVLIGNLLFAAIDIYTNGNGSFDWGQFASQIAIIVLGVISPDPKTVGYERTDVIKNAKIQGQIVTPNALSDSKIKDAATAAKAQTGGNVDAAVTLTKNSI